MPASFHTIGIDFGTTALKAVVFDGHAELQRWSFRYPLRTDEPGQAEQDYPQLRGAFLQALDELEGYCRTEGVAPRAVGFSVAMHSLITVTAAGRSPLYTWADTRAPTSGRPVNTHYQRTGVPYHPMTPAVKLAWLGQREDPRGWVRLSGLKEELLKEFFGVFWTDVSTAAATGLMNLDGRYDPVVLDELRVREAQLPEIHAVDAPLPPMQNPWRERYACLARATWVAGANDGVTATLGLGVEDAGQAAVSVGTSAAIRTLTQTPVLDPDAALFCYRMGQRFLVGAPSNNGGIVLNWLRDTLDGPQELAELIRNTAPGAHGLLCVPFLAGERAPIWNPDSSGAFIGLRLHHERADLMRAAMEGVAFQLAWLKDLLAQHVSPLRELRVTGGLTRSAPWVQVLADILNEPLFVPEGAGSFEGSAFGAARLAARAVGEDLRAQLEFDVVQPGPNAALYAPLNGRYRAAVRALQALP